MEERKELICPVCNASVTLTEPVGPPMADHRVAHLRCWIRTRRGVTDHSSEPGRRGRRSKRWRRRSRRKRAMLFTGSVLIFALAILCVLALEWLVDLVLK